LLLLLVLAVILNSAVRRWKLPNRVGYMKQNAVLNAWGEKRASDA